MAAARLPAAQWMNAGSLPGVARVVRNLSATAGSGDWPLNGMLKNLIPAAWAAAASASMLAPASVGRRRLMIDAKPSFLISGTPSGFVAPPQATVVSSRAKFATPGTSDFVTCCAPEGRGNANAKSIRNDRRNTIEDSSPGSAPGTSSSYVKPQEDQGLYVLR